MPRAKANAPRVIGVNEFLRMTFKTHKFEGAWADSFGPEPEINFTVLVHGDPKNGKTEFCVQFAKYLSRFGLVDYYSSEQGASSGLQKAWIRNKMVEVAGKVNLIQKYKYPRILERLAKKNSAKFVFLDSQNYLGISAEDFQELRDRFPEKAFIMICWSERKRFYLTSSKKLEFEVDIVAYVKQFVAHVQGRFEGGANYVIVPHLAPEQEKAIGYQTATMEDGEAKQAELAGDQIALKKPATKRTRTTKKSERS